MKGGAALANNNEYTIRLEGGIAKLSIPSKLSYQDKETLKKMVDLIPYLPKPKESE